MARQTSKGLLVPPPPASRDPRVALVSLTGLYGASLWLVHDAVAHERSLLWRLVLLICALALATLLAHGPRRSVQGAAFWLASAALLLLAEDGAAGIIGALIGVLVAAGTERFSEADLDAGAAVPAARSR